MKLPVRIILAFLCAAMIAGMPFFLSSPAPVAQGRDTVPEEEEEEDEGEVLDFGSLFFPAAMAEAAEDDAFSTEEMSFEELLNTKDQLSIPDSWELPWDFSIPPEPDPEGFTEDGYEDASIRVHIEEREMKDSVVHIAFVEIASPTQLRTATAYGVNSGRTIYVETMAKKSNAVIAMNGDYYAKEPQKKRFEVRMTQLVTYDFKRNLTSKVKDTLIIDKSGDFHLFLLSQGLAEYTKEHGKEIANAFMFGPALVVDGAIPDIENRTYDYNRTGKEPRSAIGQTGPLSYVMAVVEARGKSEGVSHMELAEIMLELGCVQAYNLDGGNSAEMIMIGPDPDLVQLHVKGDQVATERSLSDIIYFATAVPEGERGQ